ncbi:unnamed protein product, partial [Symbiodinium necroappetens]
ERSQPTVHGVDTGEDSQLPWGDEEVPCEDSAEVAPPDEPPAMELETAKDSVEPMAMNGDVQPEPMDDAGPSPNGDGEATKDPTKFALQSEPVDDAGQSENEESVEQDAKPLIPEGAVELPESIKNQLNDYGLDADLQLFMQQRALKAQAREQKAQKVLESATRAQAKAKAKAQAQTEPEAAAKRQPKAKAGRKRKADEAAGQSPEAPVATPGPGQVVTTAPDSAGPTDKPAKQAKKGEAVVGDIMHLLEPAFRVGLQRPNAKEQTQKSYTIVPPETIESGSKLQVIANKNNYYVLETCHSPLIKMVMEQLKLKVNEKHGTNVNFNRYSYKFGFKVARILSGWIPEPAQLPEPDSIQAFVEASEMAA